ncbi:MAG: hypothetical protein D3926_08015 [Desulfobacteraceae bacterium]|nr:MAG: hypothetical protein D3926_08015 [Desulfobacteraceae bacterium]
MKRLIFLTSAVLFGFLVTHTIPHQNFFKLVSLSRMGILASMATVFILTLPLAAWIPDFKIKRKPKRLKRKKQHR